MDQGFILAASKDGICISRHTLDITWIEFAEDTEGAMRKYNVTLNLDWEC